MKQFYTNKRIWVITLTTGTVLLLATLVKIAFTTWELIHILIPLVLLSPIAASLFGKRLQVELNETVYMAILIAPLLVALLAKDSLSAAVCLANGATPIRNTDRLLPGDAATICGYLHGCVAERIGTEQHQWEVCQLSDPLDPRATVLLYNDDLTLNADNQFDWSSLTIFHDGALVAADVWVWDIIQSSADCALPQFCSAPRLPRMEVSPFRDYPD